MSLPNELRRFIPSVSALLSTKPIVTALETIPRWAVLQETRDVVDEIREGEIPIVTEEREIEQWRNELGELISERALKTSQYSLRRCINATGVVLHTNMGRALLSEQAIEHMTTTARHYSNLELNLTTGERGSRYDHVSELICELTGAEDAIVVNNNAAAVLLCLSELARSREVVIARGELVEIGGSFRIPEIMKLSGCTLKEIGSTNRVHLQQYEDAITEDTALLLKVHTSNYKVVGFTKTVDVPELVPLATAKGLPIMHDLGSGSLVDLREFGLPHEPTVQEAMEEGADVVTFSGDKLLGGPQIGVIAGKRELIARMKKNQLLRAIRVDKLTLAALEGTLRVYRDTKVPAEHLPGLRMLSQSPDAIEARAKAFADRLADTSSAELEVRVVPGTSVVGAGAAPESGLPTHLVALRRTGIHANDVDAALRGRNPAVMVRIVEGEVYVDLRTVSEDEEAILEEALVTAFAS